MFNCWFAPSFICDLWHLLWLEGSTLKSLKTQPAPNERMVLSTNPSILSFRTVFPWKWHSRTGREMHQENQWKDLFQKKEEKKPSHRATTAWYKAVLLIYLLASQLYDQKHYNGWKWPLEVALAGQVRTNKLIMKESWWESTNTSPLSFCVEKRWTELRPKIGTISSLHRKVFPGRGRIEGSGFNGNLVWTSETLYIIHWKHHPLETAHQPATHTMSAISISPLTPLLRIQWFCSGAHSDQSLPTTSSSGFCL